MDRQGALELRVDESKGEMAVSNYRTDDPDVVRYFSSLQEDRRQGQL